MGQLVLIYFQYMMTMISIVKWDESTINIQLIQTETNLIFFCVTVVLFSKTLIGILFSKKLFLSNTLLSFEKWLPWNFDEKSVVIDQPNR